MPASRPANGPSAAIRATASPRPKSSTRTLRPVSSGTRSPRNQNNHAAPARGRRSFAMTIVTHDIDITADVFDCIKDEAAFYHFVCSQYRRQLRRSGLTPNFTQTRLFQAHEAWVHDIGRMSDTIGDGENTPDHFKQCGFLAYWLRRFAPVHTCEAKCGDASLPRPEKQYRDFLLKYWVEYLAFDLGVRICQFFEKYKEGGRDAPPRMTPEYFETVCYFMKYKHVSPHGLTLIYKSLFI